MGILQTIRWIVALAFLILAGWWYLTGELTQNGAIALAVMGVIWFIAIMRLTRSRKNKPQKRERSGRRRTRLTPEGDDASQPLERRPVEGMTFKSPLHRPPGDS